MADKTCGNGHTSPEELWTCGRCSDVRLYALAALARAIQDKGIWASYDSISLVMTKGLAKEIWQLVYGDHYTFPEELK